ncbi:MAG: Undecaprenyl-diphosphatase, partial [uncultured Acidimicrobiales bacterium]
GARPVRLPVLVPAARHDPRVDAGAVGVPAHLVVRAPAARALALRLARLRRARRQGAGEGLRRRPPRRHLGRRARLLPQGPRAVGPGRSAQRPQAGRGDGRGAPVLAPGAVGGPRGDHRCPARRLHHRAPGRRVADRVDAGGLRRRAAGRRPAALRPPRGRVRLRRRAADGRGPGGGPAARSQPLRRDDVDGPLAALRPQRHRSPQLLDVGAHNRGRRRLQGQQALPARRRHPQGLRGRLRRRHRHIGLVGLRGRSVAHQAAAHPDLHPLRRLPDGCRAGRRRLGGQQPSV